MSVPPLPIANLKSHPGRTFGLGLLAAILAFLLLGGFLATMGLRNGLSSLENRLGADLIVAPESAKSQTNLKEILIEGTPGEFYMNRSYLAEISQLDGVEKASPQYFLASAKADCCSFPVQIIGFDPATDFSIQPWIDRAYSHDVGRGDVVLGSNVGGTLDSSVMFYGVMCHVVAKLDKTGTSLDNAVYATGETIQDFIKGSEEQGLTVLAENDPAQMISIIQVKVADGYRISDVVDDINLHVRGVAAIQTRDMISGVADSVAGVSQVIGMLVFALAALAIVFLVVAFAVVARGRKREFAVLRMLGSSRSMLLRMVTAESAIAGALGAALGIAIGLIVFYSFGGLLESTLGVPFLAPGMGTTLLLGLLVFVVAVLACVVASAVSSVHLSKVDAGQILREE